MAAAQDTPRTRPAGVGRRAVVVAADVRGIARAAEALSVGAPGWMWLAPPAPGRARAREALSPLGPEIDAPAMNDVASSVRDRYLRMLADVAAAPPPRWWRGRIAEKEPFTSRLLADLCRIETFRLASEAHPGAVFLIGDAALLATIDPARRSAARETALWAAAWARALAARAVFVARECARMLAARRIAGARVAATLAEARTAPATAFVTWVDTRSFASGTFADTYFGDLPAEAARRTAPAFTIPWILPTVRFADTLRALVADAGPAIAPMQSLVTPADAVVAACRSLRPVPRPRLTFEGFDLAPLVAAEARADLRSNRIAFDLLMARVTTRLRSRGVTLRRVLYPFENITWEKAFLAELRRVHPEAEAVAYQHSTAPTLALDYFMVPPETATAPLPDRIEVTGRRALRTLAPVYGDAVEVLGALRYPDLPEPLPRDPETRPVILVAPSIDPAGTVEMLDTLTEALAGLDADVVLKCHPMLPYESVAPRLAAPFLHGEFALTGERPAALVARAHLVIVTSTTLAIEALASGAQVLVVTSPDSLVLSPLVDAPEAAAWACGADAVRAAVRVALAPAAIRDADAARVRAGVVADTFERASEDAIARVLR